MQPARTIDRVAWLTTWLRLVSDTAALRDFKL